MIAKRINAKDIQMDFPFCPASQSAFFLTKTGRRTLKIKKKPMLNPKTALKIYTSLSFKKANLHHVQSYRSLSPVQMHQDFIFFTVLFDFVRI